MSAKEKVHDRDTRTAGRHPSRDEGGPRAARRLNHPATIAQGAVSSPGSLTRESVLQLQRTVGNRAVLQLLTATGRAVGPNGGPVPRNVQAAIRHARGGGHDLDGTIRTHMSEAMGYDFSTVRVHTGPGADDLNRQLRAKAFTTGRDIFFRNGAYDPSSRSGREVIAHELTHVIQQGTGRVPGGGFAVRPAGDRFEQEADAQASRALRSGSTHELQRAEDLQPGSNAVQRILCQESDGRWAYTTDGGKPILMELGEKKEGRKANCHGWTYGTRVVGKHNPDQGSSLGVELIVKEEAGALTEEVNVQNDDPLKNPPSFKAKPSPGSLIVIGRSSTHFMHSAEIASALGPGFNQVKVVDKQGYEGAVDTGKPLNTVSQVTKGATVRLYPRTPFTEKVQ